MAAKAKKSADEKDPITIVRRRKGKRVKVVVNDSKISRRMLALKKEVRKRTSGIRKRHLARYAGRDLKQINWTEVEDGFLAGIKTDSKEWKHLFDVVSRTGNDREQRQLLKKLGREFGKMYEHYRRFAERSAGRIPTSAKGDENGFYKIIPEEIPYCKKIARFCILRGVHPTQLLEHWHVHVKNFTGMEFPSLSFLAHIQRVDEVALSRGSSGGSKRSERPLSGAATPRHGNSYTDLTRLDPKLRPALESAGFPTQKHNDHFLLTVQYMAVQLAKGKKFFIPPGDEKRMAKWAAENLFAKEE